MKISRKQLQNLISETLNEQASGFGPDRDGQRGPVDPARKKLQDWISYMSSTDPVVRALAIVMEEVAYGTDLKDPSRLREALNKMLATLR
jgi:hypothetical protein